MLSISMAENVIFKQKKSKETLKKKIADFILYKVGSRAQKWRKIAKKRIIQSQFTQFLAAIAAQYLLPTLVSEWVTDWVSD